MASKDLKQPFCTGQRASTITLVRREASIAGVSLSAFVEAAIASYCEALEQVRQEERRGEVMTQRKFYEPETRGGYWVRNIQDRVTDGPFVLQAEIGNHTNNPPSDDPLDWHTETFAADGAYRVDGNQSPFDLVEETQ